MNTLHARGERIIPKLPLYEYPRKTFLKNTNMLIRLFTRTKNFDAKFCFSKVESLVGGGGGLEPPYTTVIWRITILTSLPTLSERNEEIQMDFARPITNNIKDTYILVTIDRYTRYPHAEIYDNCDTDTAISYLKEYIKFHGIP